MILFENATVVDGSGGPAFQSSVLLNGVFIETIAPAIAAPAGASTIDCSGLVLAPGIVDAHSHSDVQVLHGDRAKTAQGVTTEVVGNCGFSAFPCGSHPAEVRAYAEAIFRSTGEDWCWLGAREYLADSRSRASLCHVESLIGHGTLRTAVAGAAQGPLNSRQTETMEGLLREALEGGAVGFSTGLMYAPGSSAPVEEIERLCHIVAQHQCVYATHMRSYGDLLLDAVDEQLALARTTGCRLQISHLQAVGRRNHHKQRLALDKIERARADGVDVEFDCYPYTAGSTMLTQLLPQTALDGGIGGLLERLRDMATRKILAEQVEQQMPQRWSDILIAGVATKAAEHLVGHSIAELAGDAELEPIEFVFDLLAAEGGHVMIVSFNQSEDNLRELVTHPLATVITDGVYVTGRPHPRLYGTFPRLLGTLVRDQRWLSLEDAVHRITGRPAERFGLRRRGLIAPGYIADLLLFNLEQIGSRATYENPTAGPVGIELVLREGQEIARGSESATRKHEPSIDA